MGARPSPLKGAFKKTLCTFFFLGAVFTYRISNEINSQTDRKLPVIYFTKDSHIVSHIQLDTTTEHTLTDANTRDKLPEASPNGPGSKHFKALAGQRILRTLGTQGLASRPPKLDKNKMNPKQKHTTKKSHKKPYLIIYG